MKIQKPDIPKKYRPKGFEIIHEDLDIIIVDKAAGVLSVSAKWNEHNTVHSLLKRYLQKGNPRSTKDVFVVHRLDQATSGLLVFAKTEKARDFIKDHWSENIKTYYTIVEGKIKTKSGLIQSFLEEDENYYVHSTLDKNKGKLARTEYSVISENNYCSLVKINLLTGKKNQIRVHMAELGNPVLGDKKYGSTAKFRMPDHEIMLHAYSLEMTHPFKKERFTIKAKIPSRFQSIIDCSFLEIES